MPDRYTIAVEIEAKDRTGSALGSVKNGFKETFDEVVTGAMRRVGESALDLVRQLPQMTVELAKLGVSAEAADRRFTQFAGGTERATMFLDAFNEGTDRTVDRMTAMSSAGRLLQMGLVETGDEMSQIAAMATRLGDQTMGAGERIADFAALLANQSTPRLDNFGISSGRVRQRIDELLKSGRALNREQAFKMAVMEEGAQALDTLGDTSDTAAVKLNQATAQWQNLKLEVAGATLGLLHASGTLDAASESAGRLTQATERLREYGIAGEAEIETAMRRGASEKEIAQIIANVAERYNHASPEIERYARTLGDASEIERYAYTTQRELTDEIDRGIDVTEEFSDMALRSAEAQDRAERAANRLTEQLRDQAVAAMEIGEAHLNQAMRYTDYEEQITESAEDFAEKREDLARKYQEKLAELAKRGQGYRRKIDEEELRLAVRIAQGRLEELTARQAEFNEETTDLERARTERVISNLQEEIAEKTGLLQQAHDGYIAMKGENVDALIAEETRQYEESLLALQESQLEQEEAQRQHLGQLVLNHFNAWAEMNLAADGYTKEEAEFVANMRRDISIEYGLITDTAVAAMDTQESRWEGMIAQMRGEASGFFDYFMKKFNELPSEKVIRIRYELAGRPQTAEGRLGGEAMQHGSVFAPGGMAWVGERGPELMYVPRGATVLPSDMSRHTTNHFNLNVETRATSMGVQSEFFMMQGLAGG